MSADPPSVRVNVVIPAGVEAAFRAEVFARKGMRKGNISEAITEAIRLWLAQEGQAPVGRKAAKRPTRSASPSRKRRSHQELATAKMTPGERMELAYKLSRYMRG